MGTFKEKDDQIEWVMSDNGPGLPDDFSIDGDGTLGSMLIETFAAQLGTEMKILDEREGTVFEIRFSTK